MGGLYIVFYYNSRETSVKNTDVFLYK